MPELLGQETALRQFRTALSSGRVAGAYLLHGPEGVGRSIGAQRFGALLLCAAPRGDEPCGACRSCRWNAAGSHPDFLVVSGLSGPFFRDDGDAARARADVFTRAAHADAEAGPRRTIPVRTLRRLLELLSLSAAGGGRKVALLDAFDEVEEEGAATLLKSLEEAPRDTSFLLLSGGVDRVPDTILSRCQRVRFRPLEPRLVERLLLRHGGAEAERLGPEARSLLVRLAQGSPGRGLRALGLGAAEEGAAAARALVGGALPEGVEAALAWVGAGGRDLPGQRERLRLLAALALLFLREGAGATGSSARLEALLPHVRGALESVEHNVTPELVLRALWSRSARASATLG